MNPKRTKVIVASWPDYSCNAILNGWLVKNFDGNNIAFTNDTPYLCARNIAIRDQVLPFLDCFDHFIFIDHDMRPGDHTKFFLECEADVVGCRYELSHPGAFAQPDSFHDAFFKTTSEVWRKLKDQWPWYEFGYSADGCELLKCSCVCLREKIQAAGFEIRQAGWAHHPGGNSTWS